MFLSIEESPSTTAGASDRVARANIPACVRECPLKDVRLVVDVRVLRSMRTCPKRTVGWRGAPDSRPLRSDLYRPAHGASARVDTTPDDQGGRDLHGLVGQRWVKGKAAELDDAADRDRGGGRPDPGSQA